MSARQHAGAVLFLELKMVPPPSHGLGSWNCPDCREPLDTHQPSTHDASRLLGICESCGGWYILEVSEDDIPLVAVAIPDAREILGAIEATHRRPGPVNPKVVPSV